MATENNITGNTVKHTDKRELLLLADRLSKTPNLGGVIQDEMSDPDKIPLLLEIMRTDQSPVKYTAEKVLRMISELNPALVYPYFDDIAVMLYSDNSFLKWGAIITLSNLIAIDTEKKFDKIYEKYFSFIQSDSMISAGNVIKNAWKFVLANPDAEGDITRRLLATSDHVYLNKGKPSTECSKIIAGGVIDCFDEYFFLSANKEEMIAFAASQRNNTRKAVAKKAAAFMKKHQGILSTS